jgi:hypothetical protein
MTVAAKILLFLQQLELTFPLPAGVEVMNPFRQENTFRVCDLFYRKFYNDQHRRNIILGINPGRFGGGITGIPFTDPIRLQGSCGIANDFPKKQELSSVFIYEIIGSFGGAELFYNQFYISSISPLGFTKNEKNLNYYDDKKLEGDIREFVVASLQQQLQFGLKTDIAYCLGEGKNFAYLSKLNREEKFFDKVVALAHPRFIMQYKLKAKQQYIDQYLCQLSQ